MSQSQLCWTGVKSGEELSASVIDLLCSGRYGFKLPGGRKGPNFHLFLKSAPLRSSLPPKRSKSDSSECLSTSQFILRRREMIMERKRLEKKDPSLSAGSGAVASPLILPSPRSAQITPRKTKKKSKRSLKEDESSNLDISLAASVVQWNHLPTEVHVRILEYLQVEDLFRMGRVSRHERGLLDDFPRIWKTVYMTRWRQFSREMGYYRSKTERGEYGECEEYSSPFPSDALMHIYRDGRIWQEIIGMGMWPQYACSLLTLIKNSQFGNRHVSSGHIAAVSRERANSREHGSEVKKKLGERARMESQENLSISRESPSPFASSVSSPQLLSRKSSKKVGRQDNPTTPRKGTNASSRDTAASPTTSTPRKSLTLNGADSEGIETILLDEAASVGGIDAIGGIPRRESANQLLGSRHSSVNINSVQHAQNAIQEYLESIKHQSDVSSLSKTNGRGVQIEIIERVLVGYEREDAGEGKREGTANLSKASSSSQSSSNASNPSKSLRSSKSSHSESTPATSSAPTSSASSLPSPQPHYHYLLGSIIATVCLDTLADLEDDYSLEEEKRERKQLRSSLALSNSAISGISASSSLSSVSPLNTPRSSTHARANSNDSSYRVSKRPIPLLFGWNDPELEDDDGSSQEDDLEASDDEEGNDEVGHDRHPVSQPRRQRQQPQTEADRRNLEQEAQRRRVTAIRRAFREHNRNAQLHFPPLEMDDQDDHHHEANRQDEGPRRAGHRQRNPHDAAPRVTPQDAPHPNQPNQRDHDSDDDDGGAEREHGAEGRAPHNRPLTILNRTIETYRRLQKPLPMLLWQMPLGLHRNMCARLEDLYFHSSVNLALFSSSRAVTFIPPLFTPFHLARYRLNASSGQEKMGRKVNNAFHPPVLMNAQIIRSKKKKESPKFKVKVAVWMDEAFSFSSLQVAFPLPFPLPKTHNVMVTHGTHRLIPFLGTSDAQSTNGFSHASSPSSHPGHTATPTKKDKKEAQEEGNLVEWTVPKGTSGFICFRASFSYPSPLPSPDWSPEQLTNLPIALRYSIDNGTLSNLKVRYVMQLKPVSADIPYQPLPCSVKQTIVGEQLYQSWPVEFIED